VKAISNTATIAKYKGCLRLLFFIQKPPFNLYATSMTKVFRRLVLPENPYLVDVRGFEPLTS
jgi:hypothetical protein